MRRVNGVKQAVHMHRTRLLDGGSMSSSAVGKLVARAGNGYYYGRVLHAKRVRFNLAFTRADMHKRARAGMYCMTVWQGESEFANFHAF